MDCDLCVTREFIRSEGLSEWSGVHLGVWLQWIIYRLQFQSRRRAHPAEGAEGIEDEVRSGELMPLKTNTPEVFKAARSLIVTIGEMIALIGELESVGAPDSSSGEIPGAVSGPEGAI